MNNNNRKTESIMPKDDKSNKRSRTSSISYVLISALLSGTVSYRLGMFAGCASPWLTSIQASNNVLVDVDVDDVDSPSYYGMSHTSKVADPKDRRSIPRTNVPYNCGVVFFYHIPSTGGRSINLWLQKYQKPENGNLTYYQHWALETRKDGSFHPEPERLEASFNNGMNQKVIQNLGPNEWRIAHSHLVSTYLNESEDILYKWRADVEAQGCEMINTVMLRDPLNHAMSLHKIIQSKSSTRAEWTKYLSSPTGPGLWATVLDFFLYNNHGNRGRDVYPNGPGGRNPYNVTKEVKVARAMEILHRHFDIVTVADHKTFQGKILDWTGWPEVKMPYTNVHQGEMTFTKKEVETLQKLLLKNGDVDFVDQAKLDYHDYLSYIS